ncbi:extracellular solute-binding protein [Sphaerisporangium sp. NBC_01403]|uniref:extracellular solute-binding protein n=1 Tax=Sphaerisporangium sp. NBC_01403 TaxID=2903599 RepID=UPI003254D974
MIKLGRSRAGLAGAFSSALVALAACAAPGGVSRSAEIAAVPTAPSTAARSQAPVASPSPTPTPAPTPSRRALGPGEGAVTVLTLRGYAEYGGSDPAFDWVGPFEDDTGCRVNLRFPQTGDQLDKLLAQTSYDVVSAPPELAGRLIAERKVAPLTTSLVPHYDDIPEWLRSQRSVVDGDKVYGVPYLWGSYVTLYDGATGRPAKGDALYSDPGPIMLRDSPLSIADAALALRKRRPALGVKNPFELTPAQLDAAVALVGGRGHGARTYWKDPIDALQGFAGASVRLGRALPYQLDILRRAGRPLKAVGGEPTTGWVDSWMLSAQAAAPNCAYRWLDWISSPAAQQQAAAWNGLAPANPSACGYRGDESRKYSHAERARRVCDAYRVKDKAWIKKISFAVRPARDCGGGHGECTDYAEWAARWQQLVR